MKSRGSDTNGTSVVVVVVVVARSSCNASCAFKMTGRDMTGASWSFGSVSVVSFAVDPHEDITQIMAIALVICRIISFVKGDRGS
jgi:hypothetical protein